jgi:hypothetical protein
MLKTSRLRLIAAFMTAVFALAAPPARASQGSCIMPTTGTVSGLVLVNDINACNNSLISLWSGASAPSGPQAGQLWFNTNINYIQQYDGASWFNLWYVDSTNHLQTPQIGGGIVTAAISSGSTTDLGSVPQTFKTINGTTTINSFGSSAGVGSIHFLKFAGSLTLTYNATSMILLGAANVVTQAGDISAVMYMGSSNWLMLEYTKAAAAPQSAAFSFKGNNTSGSANPTDILIAALTAKTTPVSADLVMIADSAAGNAFKKVTVGAISAIAGGTVQSVTCGTGLSGGTITTTGTCAINLNAQTASLGSDVLLNNTAIYIDGPSISGVGTGTWLVSGMATILNTATGQYFCQLWDGTTKIGSGANTNPVSTYPTQIAMSGLITNPSGGIVKLSCRDAFTTTSRMSFNQSGGSHDTTITVSRVQ